MQEILESDNNTNHKQTVFVTTGTSSVSRGAFADLSAALLRIESSYYRIPETSGILSSDNTLTAKEKIIGVRADDPVSIRAGNSGARMLASVFRAGSLITPIGISMDQTGAILRLVEVHNEDSGSTKDAPDELRHSGSIRVSASGTGLAEAMRYSKSRSALRKTSREQTGFAPRIVNVCKENAEFMNDGSYELGDPFQIHTRLRGIKIVRSTGSSLLAKLLAAKGEATKIVSVTVGGYDGNSESSGKVIIKFDRRVLAAIRIESAACNLSTSTCLVGCVRSLSLCGIVLADSCSVPSDLRYGSNCKGEFCRHLCFPKQFKSERFKESSWTGLDGLDEISSFRSRSCVPVPNIKRREHMTKLTQAQPVLESAKKTGISQRESEKVVAIVKLMNNGAKPTRVDSSISHRRGRWSDIKCVEALAGNGNVHSNLSKKSAEVGGAQSKGKPAAKTDLLSSHDTFQPNGSDCPRIEELVDYTEGLKRNAARRRIEVHITACAQCRSDLISIRDLSSATSRAIRLHTRPLFR